MEEYTTGAEARFAVIDNDRAIQADGGYSGWVQLPDGDVFVVNYVNDDAPRAYIRGYRVGREDWYLYPEGQIVTKPPYDWEGRYTVEMQEMAKRQQNWADGQDWSRRVPTQK